ncbi:alcohol dehydrogenase [Acetobacter cibinongensis NRIC 0482]|nr:alcohol dehydrogenase [Acetobacter cibinongensis NRIC 0482]
MVIEERPKPLPRPGYSVIKMHAATVNQLSGQIRRGLFNKAKAPLVLSNDGAGTVEDSDLFSPGTRVAIYGGGQLGSMKDGLQQDYVSVENISLFALPETMSFDEGAALPINYVTAYQALTGVGHIEAGQTILISGVAGAVGHALIELSRALGARPIAVVPTPLKAEAARKSGASAVIDLPTDTLSDVVSSLTTGQGADLALDVVGGSLLRDLVKSVREQGSIVSIGFAGGSEPCLDLAEIVIHEKRLLGYDAWLETKDTVSNAFNAILSFVQKGAVRPVIDSVWALDDFENAYKRLVSRQAVGTILTRP